MEGGGAAPEAAVPTPPMDQGSVDVASIPVSASAPMVGIWPSLNFSSTVNHESDLRLKVYPSHGPGFYDTYTYEETGFKYDLATKVAGGVDDYKELLAAIGRVASWPVYLYGYDSLTIDDAGRSVRLDIKGDVLAAPPSNSDASYFWTAYEGHKRRLIANEADPNVFNLYGANPRYPETSRRDLASAGLLRGPAVVRGPIAYKQMYRDTLMAVVPRRAHMYRRFNNSINRCIDDGFPHSYPLGFYFSHCPKYVTPRWIFDNVFFPIAIGRVVASPAAIMAPYVDKPSLDPANEAMSHMPVLNNVAPYVYACQETIRTEVVGSVQSVFGLGTINYIQLASQITNAVQQSANKASVLSSLISSLSPGSAATYGSRMVECMATNFQKIDLDLKVSPMPVDMLLAMAACHTPSSV